MGEYWFRRDRFIDINASRGAARPRKKAEQITGTLYAFPVRSTQEIAA